MQNQKNEIVDTPVGITIHREEKAGPFANNKKYINLEGENGELIKIKSVES